MVKKQCIVLHVSRDKVPCFAASSKVLEVVCGTLLPTVNLDHWSFCLSVHHARSCTQLKFIFLAQQKPSRHPLPALPSPTTHGPHVRHTRPSTCAKENNKLISVSAPLGKNPRHITRNSTNIDCPTSGKRPFKFLGISPSAKSILGFGKRFGSASDVPVVSMGRRRPSVECFKRLVFELAK